MAKQTIGIGAAPNDGTGDTVRDAFDKVNDNFNEQYSALHTFTSNNVTVANNIFIGNSTVNSTVNSTSIIFSGVVKANSSVVAVGSNIVINTSTVFIGNSTVNSTSNSSYFQIASANVTTNTGLTVGSSTKNANGYTYLPNGLKFVWGWVAANTSVGNATFSTAFTTSNYVVTAVGDTTTATYQPAVTATNTTVAVIRTANVTAINIYWMAIGL